jgi:hypothetical protein
MWTPYELFIRSFFAMAFYGKVTINCKQFINEASSSTSSRKRPSQERRG